MDADLSGSHPDRCEACDASDRVAHDNVRPAEAKMVPVILVGSQSKIQKDRKAIYMYIPSITKELSSLIRAKYQKDILARSICLVKNGLIVRLFCPHVPFNAEIKIMLCLWDIHISGQGITTTIEFETIPELTI